MLEPFWLIVAVLAVATVLLWPLRAWIASRRARDADSQETPLAPPKRRSRG